MSINYRADVDGLRALAVIPVVFFHMGVPGFSGGFIGVDVFFVISGYLITNILYSELVSNTFSIKRFYYRRIKRIFPALFTVLIVSMVMSHWLMMNGEFAKYQESLLSTLLFYSNYYFMFDIGYFATAAEKKPLLHMWSLAVEEQFYLLFPVFLLIVFRYLRSYLNLILIAVLLISFTYAVILVKLLPSDAFYSTPARAWELMIGAILAVNKKKVLVMSSRMASSISWLGFISIVAAIFLYSKNTPFPGLAAVLPVVGSGFIIAAGSGTEHAVKKILSAKPVVFIGLISYSLYLWHWPVLIFYNFYSVEKAADLNVFPALFLLMLVLSYISWKFIESPFRKGKLFNNHRFFKSNFKSVLLLLGIILIVTGAFANARKKYPVEVRQALKALSVSNRVMELNDCKSYITDSFGKRLYVCHIGDLQAEENSFAVIGDSHARALLAGISESARNQGLKGIYVGSGGCLPLIGAHQVHQGLHNCKKLYDGLLEYLEAHPNIKQVYLAARWALYATGTNNKGQTYYMTDDETIDISYAENSLVFERSMIRTMDFLEKLKLKIFIITQVPESKWGARDIARAKLLNVEFEERGLTSEYMQRQSIPRTVFDRYESRYGYHRIDLVDNMCDELYCVYFEENVPIYKDDNHITKTYALKLAKIYDDSFAELTN